MGKLERTFSTDFAHGLIKCLLVFEGPSAEKYPDMLDNIHKVVSKFVYQVFVTKIHEGVEMFQPSSGETNLTETFKFELLDHVFTLEIDLNLNIEAIIPELALRAMLAETIATGVFADAIPRFSHRLFVENAEEQLRGLAEARLAELVEGGGSRTGIIGSMQSLASHAGVGIPFPMPLGDR